MLRLLRLSVGFVILGSLGFCAYGSSSSPWGVNAVWDVTLPFTAAGNTNDRCKDYNHQLDSTITGGLSWARPANMPGCQWGLGEINLDGIQYELHISSII
ncbi:MAG: hypothetical protein PHX21_01770 [bacterium]|nr:hypothetical protein [bacterium]